ncbi:MAG: DUF305 domain-containing protein [Gemmatimonadales bacterium]|nr:MAG: DUF305 domain-containing protein [Gemmatimonadales bacterium]
MVRSTWTQPEWGKISEASPSPEPFQGCGHCLMLLPPFSVPPGFRAMVGTLGLGLLTACVAGPPVPPEPPASPSPAAAPADAGVPALTAAEIEALYRERLAGSRTRFTEADVRFMTDMIHHHAQALEMAVLAPTNGASTPVQALAGRILISQQDEITLMGQWLEDRERPAPIVDLETGQMLGSHHHDHHDHHDHSMPGMIDDDRMARLAGSHGTDFDRLFLTLMIEHHEGAVTMVRDLFASDGAGQDEEIFRFASDVHADQVIEVARMRLLLASLGGPPDMETQNDPASSTTHSPHHHHHPDSNTP